MKISALSLILCAILLSACGVGAVQQAATDQPKSPPATKTLKPLESLPPDAPASGDLPTSNETPYAMDSTPSPLEPLPDEENMVRGEAFVDSAEILLLESYPVQVNLHVTGMLPTPCHMLHANVGQPDEKGRIDVELYSLSEPGVICIQMLQPFDTTIPLGTFPSGDYTVYVNGKEAGKFTV